MDFKIADGLCIIDSLYADFNLSDDNFKTVKNAIEFCRANGLKGIKLPTGRYPIFNTYARELFSLLLSGKVSPFDYEYWHKNSNVLFQIKDFKEFSIIGDNTCLLADGLISICDFCGVGNAKLQGISVDWINLPFFTATVDAIKDNTVYIRPLNQGNLLEGAPIVSFQNYDLISNHQKGMCAFEGISNLKSEGCGRFNFTSLDVTGLNVGDGIIARYLYSYAPIIHFYQCENIDVKNVTLNAGTGMGVIAHKCGNGFFENYKVMPKDGRPMSINVDATHFISCYGKISFQNCYFEAMGDDAVNVHGFYLTVDEILESKQVKVSIESGCQDGVFDCPDKGDVIEFINRADLTPFGEGIIDDVTNNQDGTACITFKEDLPKKLTVGSVLGNASKTAELTVENCTVRNIRGRAMLIQTRNAMIKNNLFEGCTGQGVHIDTADGWMESIGTRNITVTKNKFINCGYGITKYCDAVGVVVETEASRPAVGVHKNIVITDNYIKGENTGLKLMCAENVTLKGNTFDGCCEKCDISYCKSINSDI